jgi:hypothetical protein
MVKITFAFVILSEVNSSLAVYFLNSKSQAEKAEEAVSKRPTIPQFDHLTTMVIQYLQVDSKILPRYQMLSSSHFSPTICVLTMSEKIRWNAFTRSGMKNAQRH